MRVRRRGPAAVPPVRPAARPAGPPLPAPERSPAELTGGATDPCRSTRPDHLRSALAPTARGGDPRRDGRGDRRGEDPRGRRGRRRGDEQATSVDALGLPMPVLAADEALTLLRDGELELVGRLWASTNNAMLCLGRAAGRPSRARRRVHLQAGHGRAAAGRLPRLHAGPPRGGRVRRLAGDRLGDRAAHRPARRAVRRGHGPALDPGGRRGGPGCAGRRGGPLPAAGSPCSTPRSTTPTARPATCSRCRAVTCTAWTTG